MSEENKNEETLVESENLEATVVEEVVEDKPAEVAPVVEEVAVEKAVVEDKPATEVENVITNVQGKGKSSEGKPALTPVENGTIGTGTVKPTPKPAAKKPVAEVVDDTVALHSTRNVVWQGVGKVNRGVNIVSKAEAEQWLTRNHVTVLTPEQVAKEYNK